MNICVVSCRVALRVRIAIRIPHVSIIVDYKLLCEFPNLSIKKI
jgi:hypothetical protein